MLSAEGPERFCASSAYAVFALEAWQIRVKFRAFRKALGNNMDPIANMLIIIKNGYMAQKPEVLVPFSKFKLEIAKVLEKEGFISKVQEEDKKLKLALVYENKKPRLSEIKRVSKSGLRVYSSSKKLQQIKGGIGITIVSTSQGVMTGKEAKNKKLGGEVICLAW